MLENEIYSYTPSEYLVVSVDLPVVGQVVEASVAAPYLCMQIDIDLHLMSELLTHDAQMQFSNTAIGRGIFVGRLDAALLDSALRLVSLLDKPDETAFVAPLILREIHYRLLNSPYGAIIAQLALQGSQMKHISQVIAMLKTDFHKPIRIETMALLANMSPSTFYAHFKKVTAMSPLQYQKRLRLLEARRLLLTQSANAANAGYQVGYESSSQFSREYARMFGAPPAADMQRLRVRFN